MTTLLPDSDSTTGLTPSLVVEVELELFSQTVASAAQLGVFTTSPQTAMYSV
jgi:hypothetical protein